MEKLDVWDGVIIGLGIILLISVCLIAGNSIGSSIIKKEAIEHECAQYNPKTGDFEWVK
jgi:hypothetical protein